MSKLFPHLFSPLKLRHTTLKHRLSFGAHTANMSEGGLPAERHLGYYAERARGGAAMIVVEPVPAHRTAVLTRGNFRHSDDSIVPHFRRITDACHEYGTVMIQQIYHVGGHGDYDNSLEPNWSPSGFPSYHDADGSHALTEAEIEEVIEAFVQAARRAWLAGFDGVELMAAYNALIEQFWLPLTNRRDDRWGGPFDHRMRFSTEICQRIRATAGEDFIIGLATSVDEGTEGAFALADLQEVAAYHDRRGLIDYLTVGTGSYFDFTKIIPHHLHAEVEGSAYAAAVREVVEHTRVQAESRIKTAANAERVIAEGRADMVSIVRGLIADPHLANKAMEDRPADIRPCISCNQGCWARRHRDYYISCLINPSAGREFQWGGDRFAAAQAPRRVLVVGGGPAGLEAARVAAERGHRVALVERRQELGGAFRMAAEQPSRQEIHDLLGWYRGQLKKLRVTVRLGEELDADAVATEPADVVVVATGSRPARDGFQRAMAARACLPGVDQNNVFAVDEVLEGAVEPGARVMLLDDTGGWPGAGTALFLAERGHDVTIVTGAPMVAMALVPAAADGNLRARLAKAGVESIANTVLLSWHGTGARLRGVLDGVERELAFDSLVLATTNVPEDDLTRSLAGGGLEVHAIGDCVAPRRALAAIYEGRRLGLAL